MGAVIINGSDNFDDNISSGGIGSGDTLVSSTFGGNDTVSIFSANYDVFLGAGNDVLQGGSLALPMAKTEMTDSSRSSGKGTTITSAATAMIS